MGCIVSGEVSVAGCPDEVNVGKFQMSLKDTESCGRNAASKISSTCCLRVTEYDDVVVGCSGC